MNIDQAAKQIVYQRILEFILSGRQKKISVSLPQTVMIRQLALLTC
jgi:hypothetical protein